LHVWQPQAPYRRDGKRVKTGRTEGDHVADAGITATVLDAHTSAVEGSIGAIPRRLVVAAEDEARARHVLEQAGEI
jgi:hypothetical protein